MVQNSVKRAQKTHFLSPYCSAAGPSWPFVLKSSVYTTQIINLNTTFINFNTKFINFNTKFINLNTEFINFNTKFINLNKQFINLNANCYPISCGAHAALWSM